MKTKVKTDIQLITEFNNGNQASLESLINRHKEKLFSYILITVKKRDLAEDIFQETFIKIVKSLSRGKYSDNGKFISWAVRIAHNLIIDHYRKKNQTQITNNDDYEYDIFNQAKFSESTIEDDIIQTQITEKVKELLNYLPDDQKEVIMMRHYGGLSFKEIAKETGVSINTALGRMRYAIINLRRLIEEKNISLTV